MRFSTKFSPLQKPSRWRRISIATWRAPDDPTVITKLKFDMTTALPFLEDYNQKNNCKVTVTQFVSKIIALTLKKYPDINGIIRWKRIYLRNSIDIFLQVAVAVEENQKPDLTGIKINNCDQKSLKEICDEVQNKALRARAKDTEFESSHKIMDKIPAFILSPIVRFMSFLMYNLGIVSPALGLADDPFGSCMITSTGSLKMPIGFAPLVPISRVPMIICVGAVEKRAWVVDDKIEVRPILDMGVTFDHRFMDGYMGAKMVTCIRELISKPELVL